ncbi:imidazolonepropionase-like domain-containing protein [Streptomyces fagopyri]|uniref:imidazolonepropionase-like domain-containing protein n=1 Tax=Streptomyces fagopyri TaxID=2662397 RepID=UPI00382A0981
MLTLHAADELRLRWDTEPVRDGAVAVRGDRVVGAGALSELRERFPEARLRRWPGVLGPALVHEGPLPQAPSPRERLHAVLKSGSTAVLERYADTAELRAAAVRNEIAVLPRVRESVIVDTGRADLAVFDTDGACVATVCAGRLVHRRR